jgi:hypothetical protein
MAYDGPQLEWLKFEPDSNTDIILLKFWDKIKDGNQGKYKAHFYRVQHVDTQEEMMLSASNTLHEKIMQTGAEIGAVVTITRVGKGKSDTRWMAKVVNGNIDQARADLWEHGDPDPFDPTATTAPQQQPPAPPPAQPHQNTQTAPPAQPTRPASDPAYNVYVPKPEEHWSLQEVKAAEGARRRRMAFDATVAEFEDVKPEKLTPAQELAWLEQMFNASAGNGVELSKNAYHDWESGRKTVLKEDVPGYTEPEPEPEPEKLVFENDQEALAALATDIPTFFDIVATHEYFKGLGSLSVAGAKKVANQFGFKLPPHLKTEAQKLNVARMIWTYADFMLKDSSEYAEYLSLRKTATKFDFPEEVIDTSGVKVPPDVQTQNDVEDALNGDDSD